MAGPVSVALLSQLEAYRGGTCHFYRLCKARCSSLTGLTSCHSLDWLADSDATKGDETSFRRRCLKRKDKNEEWEALKARAVAFRDAPLSLAELK